MPIRVLWAISNHAAFIFGFSEKAVNQRGRDAIELMFGAFLDLFLIAV
ncbi:hypothetical protein ACP_1180 [Acidobacterium capsulatum ATCC 51196]|jgi:hypothetical protein|uniref:Uncharacterized protein n=1 Tax=Acidobacterium capsulatum (strain ATCC 51196 / DSM 11244 / BCRC 80197 / JCM 7670 / NBRC 15755 / NCIMB 13165 / 161) TaxID=240015 RepID=C1F4Q9_ACIC5|nr:hypothetical protein ACP_1180 [Acidobacterium capsulatum ATCC 51196]